MKRAALLAGALALAGLLFFLLPGHGGGPAAAASGQAGGPPTAGDGFEPVLGMPATKVVVLGSSPSEESGEAWAYGTIGDVPAIVNGAAYAEQVVLLEHTETSGWQVVPLPSGPEGKPLSPNSFGGPPETLQQLGGRVTATGGVVLLTGGGIVVRDPGGAPRLLSGPGKGEGAEEASSDELLGNGESLPPAPAPSEAGTPYAAIEEASGHTGVLIAPYGDGAGAAGASPTVTGPGVLHYDGEKWTREPIAWKGSSEEKLTPQALSCGGTQADAGANSPRNCWLLASYRAGASGSEANRLGLFRRTPTKAEPSEYTWERVPVADWLLGEQPPPAGVSGPPSVQTLGATAQTLTVTAQGVWVDFQARIDGLGAATDVSELVSAPATEGAGASVAGTWCYPTVAAACEHALGGALPAQYRSFAQPGSSAGGVGGSLGTRIITGLPSGAMLELAGGGFEYTIGAGGNGGGASGAAFNLSDQGAVEQGWLGEGDGEGGDSQGQSQLVDVTPQPQGDQLQPAPVPFRHPLLAVAQAPGSAPGDPVAQAIAVGVKGEVGRYTPGQGWSPEALYNASGETQSPTLRGVAWPEPGRAYAVGDAGEMWLWRADTGLWEPDPATPYNFVGNLTGIAFSPGDPGDGYAVGKQGVLLKYGKSWEQVPLPAELQRVNFTSIAFAGGEALATYRVVTEDSSRSNEQIEAGGLAVEDGSGWHVDPSAGALLAQLPNLRDTVLSKVAGLPDGGAIAAGPGLVIKRESPAAEWRFSSQPLPEAQNISALAAYREGGGPVRAVISIDLDGHLNPNNEDLENNAFSGDLPAPSGSGQPPAYLPPDPLPNSGYVLKETAAGWSDIEHMALEATDAMDMPVRPDPVRALIVSPTGQSGLAVGGQTDDNTGSPPSPNPFETAAAMRFGAGAAAAGGDAPAPIATTRGVATFAVGGAAACEQACANFAGESLAPDTLLSRALTSANQIAASAPGGLRGFLYTGDRLQAGSSSLGAEAFQRELTRYATLLGSGGPLTVHAAASPNDLAPVGGIAPFVQTLQPFVPGAVAGSAYYSFLSTGASGDPVRVIVLDFSSGELGAAQRAWLQEQLKLAQAEGPGKEGYPAIVMGNASLGFVLPEAIGQDPAPVQARDATAVSQILVAGEASAYLFDYPGVNVKTEVSDGTGQIPAFGTGTLGYASPPGAFQTDSPGSSGFLLIEVDTAAARTQATPNVVPVSARVEPNIGELALDATDGVLLRRSQAGLFEALARIPASGQAVQAEASGEVTVFGPEPYEPIPFDCQGADCADTIATDYTFTSSNPDIGNFVAHEAASHNPLQVELGPNKLPLADSHSGLFCAFNAGTTTVSITAGGLTYSEPVTVQGGSAEFPCGTVPLKNPPPREARARASFDVPTLSPATNPPPASPHVQAIVPPPPPVVPVAAHHAHHPPLALPIVPLALPALFPLRPVVPPPAPNPARPTPPSGTAPVSQTVGLEEQEQERESATELVHHMVALDRRQVRVGGLGPRRVRVNAIGLSPAPASELAPGHSSLSAYHPDNGPMPAWPVALVLVAVAGGIGLRRRAGSERLAYVGAGGRGRHSVEPRPAGGRYFRRPPGR